MPAPDSLALVDTHVHFWDRARLDYPWLAEVPSIAASHVPADYWRETAAHEVQQLIFVEGDCAPAQARQENDWALELAAEDPRIAAAVAQIVIDAGAETARDLHVLAGRPLVAGVRHLIQGQADPDYCLRPTFVQGVSRLADLDLNFDLCIKHTQLPATIRLVEQCPEVRFVLDHLGKPDVRGHALDPWQEQLGALAAHPNVWCKLSGLLTEADHANWQPADFAPYLAHALEVFGADRLLFGSDWPVCRLAGSFSAWVALVQSALASLTPDQQDGVFRRNAGVCYGFATAAS